MARLLVTPALMNLKRALRHLSLVMAYGASVGTTAVAAAPQATPAPAPRPIRNGTFPVVSPDGRLVAFTSDRSGSEDVYVIASDGTNERRVTTTPDAEGNLAWTPDGKRILFVTFKDDRSRLFAIEPTGTNVEELAVVPGRAPTLSPDGKRLLYMAGTWTATVLTVADRDGSNPHAITDGSSVAWNAHWSPDGKRIAFTSRDEPKSELAIFVMNADGTARKQLTHVPAEEGGAQLPAWSPDGRSLAIQVNTRTLKNQAHVWIVDADTGAGRKLAAHDEAWLDEAPTWFPSGKGLAFQSNRTGRMEIWVMDADGKGPRQLTSSTPR